MIEIDKIRHRGEKKSKERAFSSSPVIIGVPRKLIDIM